VTPVHPTTANGTRLVILLGPQGVNQTLSTQLTAHGIDGRIATVTCGWREREDEVQDLQAHLDGRSENLQLYRRTEQLAHEDPELARIHRARQDELRLMQRLYAIRLERAMDACVTLARRSDDSAILQREQAAALEAVRELDTHHLQSIQVTRERYDEQFALEERPAVQRQRDELREIISRSCALAIAGGHIAVLMNRLRLMGIGDMLGDHPVIGWSAGAIALTERIVLYHDSPPQGPGNAEVLDHGLGICRGVVALPAAGQRLRLDDPERVARLAGRFAPAHCIALDDGAALSCTVDEWQSTSETRVLRPGGTVEEFGH
jgi:hypothetical protein